MTGFPVRLRPSRHRVIFGSGDPPSARSRRRRFRDFFYFASYASCKTLKCYLIVSHLRLSSAYRYTWNILRCCDLAGPLRVAQCRPLKFTLPIVQYSAPFSVSLYVWLFTLHHILFHPPHHFWRVQRQHFQMLDRSEIQLSPAMTGLLRCIYWRFHTWWSAVDARLCFPL